MSKKTELEAPDLSKIKTVASVDDELAAAKTTLHRKVKQQLQTKENKREEMASFNEAIKEFGEEIDHLVGVIDVLESHRKQLLAGQGLSAIP